MYTSSPPIQLLCICLVSDRELLLIWWMVSHSCAVYAWATAEPIQRCQGPCLYPHHGSCLSSPQMWL